METIKRIKEKIEVMTLVRYIVITLCLSIAYYSITMYTAPVSITGSVGIRMANSLKALYLFSPLALGTQLGAFMVTLQLGRVGIGIYGISNLINGVLGLLTYKIANSGRMSHTKNFLSLTFLGCTSGFLVAFNHALTRAPVLFGTEFMNLFWSLVWLRMLTSTLAIMCGYPLYLAVKGYKERRYNG